jgi:hypothetical protein
MLDLLIKICIHPWLGNRVDIGVRDGKIASIGLVNEGSESVLDAEGCLVLESFTIPHLHLCKAYTLELVGLDAVSLYRNNGMSSSSKSIEYANVLRNTTLLNGFTGTRTVLLRSAGNTVLHILGHSLMWTVLQGWRPSKPS